jgi:hypothetical protein
VAPRGERAPMASISKSGINKFWLNRFNPRAWVFAQV